MQCMAERPEAAGHQPDRRSGQAKPGRRQPSDGRSRAGIDKAATRLGQLDHDGPKNSTLR